MQHGARPKALDSSAKTKSDSMSRVKLGTYEVKVNLIQRDEGRTFVLGFDNHLTSTPLSGVTVAFTRNYRPTRQQNRPVIGIFRN